MMRTVNATGAALTVQKFILGCGQCGAKPTQSMLQPHNQRGTNSNVNPITMGEASVAQSTRCKVRVPQHGGPQVPAPLWGPSLVGCQRLGHGCPRRWLRLPQCPTLANSEGTQDLGAPKVAALLVCQGLGARCWHHHHAGGGGPLPPLRCLHWGRGRGLTAGQRAAVPSVGQSNCPWL